MKKKDGMWVNNAVPLCRSCNSTKSDGDFREFFGEERLLPVLQKNSQMTIRLNGEDPEVVGAQAEAAESPVLPSQDAKRSRPAAEQKRSKVQNSHERGIPMLKDLPDLDKLIDGDEMLILAVTKEEMSSGSFGNVGHFIERSRNRGVVSQLVGRIKICFPEFDEDPREIPEIPQWMKELDSTYPEITYLVEPSKGFKLLAYCNAIRKNEKTGEMAPDERALEKYIESAGSRFVEFAMSHGMDMEAAQKQFLEIYMNSSGDGKATFICAACYGELTGEICTVVFNDSPVDLCRSCLELGSPEQKTEEEIQRLVASRANPRADPNKASEYVAKWLEHQN